MNLGPQKSTKSGAEAVECQGCDNIADGAQELILGQCQVQTAHSHPGSAFFVGCSCHTWT